MSKEKIKGTKTRTAQLIQAGFVQPELLKKKVRKRVEKIFTVLEAKGAVIKTESGFAPSPKLKDPTITTLLKIYQQK